MTQGAISRTNKRRKGLRRVISILYWTVNDPLARGMELFLTFLNLRVQFLDLIFYYAQLVNIEATFLGEEETKTIVLCCRRRRGMVGEPGFKGGSRMKLGRDKRSRGSHFG